MHAQLRKKYLGQWVTMPTLSARSIARSLLEDLSVHPFSGYVLGVYRQACNLIDAQGRMIALTLPDIGNGPFSIVVENGAQVFARLDANQPAQADRHALTISDWRVTLGAADLWEPKIPIPAQPLKIKPPLANLIAPYVDWPRLAPETPLARHTARVARNAAYELRQALIQKKSVQAAVAQLAGLGSGLTPAGDDYLVGVMAALWLTGQPDIPPQIAQTAMPRTTALSAAFLKAAANSEFIEPWHELVQALLAADAARVDRAARHMARFGASSGIDALAGFAAITLNI